MCISPKTRTIAAAILSPMVRSAPGQSATIALCFELLPFPWTGKIKASGHLPVAVVDWWAWVRPRLNRRERRLRTHQFNGCRSSDASGSRVAVNWRRPTRRLCEQQRRTWICTKRPGWHGWPCRGRRIGEAANPGPAAMDVDTAGSRIFCPPGQSTHYSAWNELTVTIGPWYKSQHGASMDPTVKRLASGQASQSWMVVTVPKNRTQNKDKKQQQKKQTNQNHKQNPQSARRRPRPPALVASDACAQAWPGSGPVQRASRQARTSASKAERVRGWVRYFAKAGTFPQQQSAGWRGRGLSCGWKARASAASGMPAPVRMSAPPSFAAASWLLKVNSPELVRPWLPHHSSGTRPA